MEQVKLKNKYGYIKSDGSYLVEPKFDDIFDFDNRVALIELNGEYRKINTVGKLI